MGGLSTLMVWFVPFLQTALSRHNENSQSQRKQDEPYKQNYTSNPNRLSECGPGKNEFHACGMASRGEVVREKRFTRARLERFTEPRPPCRIGLISRVRLYTTRSRTHAPGLHLPPT